MADKWDERKKAQEDEYFVKKERELVAKLKAKMDAGELEHVAEKDDNNSWLGKFWQKKG
jgi:hypothetical protein